MSETLDLSSHERRLHEILAAYYQAVESGQAVSPEEIIAKNPEFAEDLEKFFLGHDDLDHLAAPVRGTDENEPIARSLDATPTQVHGATPRSSDRPTSVADYEILEEIAQGGMGVVYKARQIKVGRIVALKMMLRGRASREDLARFRLEAEAAANLDHPNIVPIHEVGEHDGQPYFTMKFIEGGSLSEALTTGPLRDRASTRRAAIRLMALVSRAVHFAHQHGILHRDLKPGNILLQEGARNQEPGARRKATDRPSATGSWILDSGSFCPYVTDFGLAKRLDNDSTLTESGAVVGTPAFMAPEQALGRKQLTTAVDVYSLGAILYLILTGQKPFPAESPAATLLMLSHQEPSKPTSIDRQIPEDLETICLKCLEKEPARRYASAEALAEDLERWLQGIPIAARAMTTAERVMRWIRRRPAIAGLLALLGLTVIGAFTAVTLHWLEADRQRRIAEHERSVSEDARQALAEALEASERTQYAYQVGAAVNDYRYSADSALVALDRCDPARRGWEWYVIRRNCTLMPFVFRGQGDVRELRSQRNGPMVLSLHAPGRLELWNAQTGQRMSLKVEGSIRDACFADDHIVILGNEKLTRLSTKGEVVGPSVPARDANRLVPAGSFLVALADKSVHVWNAKWEKAASHTTQANIVAAVANEQADQLALALSDGTIQVLRLATLQVESEWAAGAVRCLALAPDGKSVATGSEASVTLWNSANGKRLRDLPTATLCSALGLIFTPDSTRLISASKSGLQIWCLDSGQSINLYQAVGESGEMTMTKQGTLAWARRHGDVIVLRPDLPPSPVTLPLRGRALAISGDGTALAVASGSEVHIVATSSAETAAVIPVDRQASQVHLSHNGNRLAVLTAKEISVWDIKSRKRVMNADTTLDLVALGSDGLWCAWQDREGLKLWRQGKDIALLTADKPTALAADPKKARLAAAFTANDKMQIGVFQVVTGQETRGDDRLPKSPADHIVALAFDGETDMIAAVSKNRIAMIWSTNPLKHLRYTRAADLGHQLINRYSSDGTLLAWIDPAGYRFAKIQYVDPLSDRLTLRQGIDDDLSLLVIGPKASVLAWTTSDGRARFLRMRDE